MTLNISVLLGYSVPRQRRVSVWQNIRLLLLVLSVTVGLRVILGRSRLTLVVARQGGPEMTSLSRFLGRAL